MWIIDQLAEERINEAVANGEFEHLPGAGRPLQFEDDRLVPEDLRAAYRLLKRSGCLPPEAELHREIRRTTALLRLVNDRDEKRTAVKRLDLLMACLSEMHGRGIDLHAERRYRDRLTRRLGRPLVGPNR